MITMWGIETYSTNHAKPKEKNTKYTQNKNEHNPQTTVQLH